MSKHERKTGSNAGRPCKEISRKAFEGLCRIQCTLDEMCAFLECDNKTLEKWCEQEYGMKFREVFAKKRLKGNVSLRRRLYRKGVEEGDTKILIFLAKNWLGMSDKQDVKVENPLQISSVYDLSKLTEEELLQLRGILNKAKPKDNGKTADDSGD